MEGQEEQARALWRGRAQGRRSLRAGDRTNSNRQGLAAPADWEGPARGRASQEAQSVRRTGAGGGRRQTARRGLATLPSETGGRAFKDEGMGQRKGGSFQNVQEG